MPARLNFPYNFGALGVEKLHSYFYKRFFALKTYLKNSRAGFFVRKIAGYNYILTHCALLL